MNSFCHKFHEFSRRTPHQPASAGFGVSDREFIHGCLAPLASFAFAGFCSTSEQILTRSLIGCKVLVESDPRLDRAVGFLREGAATPLFSFREIQSRMGLCCWQLYTESTPICRSSTVLLSCACRRWEPVVDKARRQPSQPLE